jgi:hypothetical protein
MLEPDADAFLEARLGGLDLPDPPEALRRRILERTSALVRARARRQRAILPLGVAAAFALGFAVAWAARGAGGPDEQSAPVGTVAPALPSSLPTPPDVGSSGAAASDPARILERVRDAPKAERPRLLRLAGDSYLARGGDIARALDCYRQLLEVSPCDADASPSPEDPWLLEVLKLSKKTRR